MKPSPKKAKRLLIDSGLALVLSLAFVGSGFLATRTGALKAHEQATTESANTNTSR